MPNITCAKPDCRGTTTRNYPDLLDNYLDKSGRIVCKCGARGYVEKKFELQEKGAGEVEHGMGAALAPDWRPLLHGLKQSK